MVKKIIVFGIGKISEVAHYYLMNDAVDVQVVAFTVEQQYMPSLSSIKGEQQTKFGLPIISFETIENDFSPSEYMLFAPCSGTNLNKYRERIYNHGKQKGYQFYTYVSSKANVYTKNIGENCFILEDNTIQPYTTIGNNCVLWSGNHIGHHSTIEDHVFITSHVVISGMCTILKYCYLGVNSSLKDNIVLEEGTVVGMSASITKNTEGNSVYIGIPGKLYKKIDDTIIL
jgi:sugar O-acyltransferase (sialic acid O-acetyltransferase NeuD family)